MENGEIGHFEQFYLFLQGFPEVFFFPVSKRVYMEERDKCYICDNKMVDFHDKINKCGTKSDIPPG